MQEKLDRTQLVLSLYHLVDAFKNGLPRGRMGTAEWKDDRTFNTVYDRILHDFESHCVGWDDEGVMESYQDTWFILLRIMGKELYGEGFQSIYDRITPPNYVTEPSYGPSDNR